MFHNRQDAGRLLAARLARYAGVETVVVLGIPRGGIPVAFEIAAALGAPLDIFIARKLGVPGHEELAFGAISTGAVKLVDSRLVQTFGISGAEIDWIVRREQRELERRTQAYRDSRPQPELVGRTVVLVDDGVATGASMQAAILALRPARPALIVVAVPVASSSAYRALNGLADEVVCLAVPDDFEAVGQFYAEFSQVSDEEVRECLDRAHELSCRSAPG